MNILLGVTASVAATLTPKLYCQLKELGNVKIVYTEKADKFIDWTQFPDLYITSDFIGNTSFSDEDEWNFSKYTKNTDIVHIRLRDWADVFVIAPLTANTLAKISHGISDNLLTCVYSAWGDKKPIIIAPAMNTEMWNNKTTLQNFNTLSLSKKVLFDNPCDESAAAVNYLSTVWRANLFCVQPISKKLACGQEGVGAMAQIDDIINTVRFAVNENERPL